VRAVIRGCATITALSSKPQKPHLAGTVEQCVVLLRVSKATQI